MPSAVPIVLIPGLNTTPRLYQAQLTTLWQFGPVTVADHRRADRIESIAQQILAQAPPRFALAGLSMGGYIAFEMWRQAPARIERLALLDTTARPDTAELSARRRQLRELARNGQFDLVTEQAYPGLVHARRASDSALKQVVQEMAVDTGAAAYIAQQSAILERADSRPMLASIHCPTLVLVGDGDQLTPPDRAQEMASAITGARLAVIEDCGHLSTLERPERVAAALARWLRGE